MSCIAFLASPYSLPHSDAKLCAKIQKNLETAKKRQTKP